MATRNASIWKSVDWITIALYFILVVCGWFSICGACYDFNETNFFDFSIRPGKQLVWIGCSLILGIVLLNIEKKYYEMYAFPVYVVFMLLLVATFFLADDTKGSFSWIELGYGIKIQPAEFAKFATTLALSKLIGSYGFNIERGKDLCKALVIILLPLGMIVAQMETGTALVFFAFFLVLYREGMTGSVLLLGVTAVVIFILNITQNEHFFAHMPVNVGLFSVLAIIPMITALMVLIYAKDRKRAGFVLIVSLSTTGIALLLSRYFIPFNVCIVQIVLCAFLFIYLGIGYMLEHKPVYILIAIFAIGSVGFYYSCEYAFNHVLKEHQQTRIKVAFGLVDDIKGSGYNVNQSKIAIGSGRLFGKGFLQGTQTKLNYVPEQDTDFIFCTIGEEKGFVGSASILVLYAIFVLRLLALAERQGGNRFSRVVGYSLVCILTTHVLINIGMVIGLIPVIGIPLPFFSYGGSSLWSFTILLAIFLRLDAERSIR